MDPQVKRVLKYIIAVTVILATIVLAIFAIVGIVAALIAGDESIEVKDPAAASFELLFSNGIF